MHGARQDKQRTGNMHHSPTPVTEHPPPVTDTTNTRPQSADPSPLITLTPVPLSAVQPKHVTAVVSQSAAATAIVGKPASTSASLSSLPPDALTSSVEYHKSVSQHYHGAPVATADKYQQAGRRRTPSLLAAEDVEGFFNNLTNPPRIVCVPAEHQQHEHQQHPQLWQQQQQQLTQLMPAAVSTLHSSAPSQMLQQAEDGGIVAAAVHPYAYVYTQAGPAPQAPSGAAYGLYSSPQNVDQQHQVSSRPPPASARSPYDGAQFAPVSAGWESAYSPHTALKSMAERYGSTASSTVYAGETHYTTMSLNSSEAGSRTTSGLQPGPMPCEWNLTSLITSNGLDKAEYYQLGETVIP